MSKIELTNYKYQNPRIDKVKFKNISICFIKDFTASQTATSLKFSRQTINSYYKLIRTYLLQYQNITTKLEVNNILSKKETLYLKYIKINQEILYYIEHENKIYLLDNENPLFEELSNFIKKDLKDRLRNHKKANCAKILKNSYSNEYFVSSFLRTSTEFNCFTTNRLKKFRGINKNNYILHIKESIIRFNSKKETLLQSLINLTKK